MTWYIKAWQISSGFVFVVNAWISVTGIVDGAVTWRHFHSIAFCAWYITFQFGMYHGYLTPISAPFSQRTN